MLLTVALDSSLLQQLKVICKEMSSQSFFIGESFSLYVLVHEYYCIVKYKELCSCHDQPHLLLLTKKFNSATYRHLSFLTQNLKLTGDDC